MEKVFSDNAVCSFQKLAPAHVRDTCVYKYTRSTVRSTVGAAEKSPYLPGPNIMPSKALFKHVHRSFLVLTSRKSPNYTAHTWAISFMDVYFPVYSKFYRF